jgi:membrane-bound ClpP family serine protease
VTAEWRDASAYAVMITPSNHSSLEIGDTTLIILGIVLLVLGFVFGIQILWILGIIALVIGAVLAIAGTAGREIGGRRHWY